MATNKHAIIRYQALDKCFRNTGRRYFIDDLISECNEALYHFTGNRVEIKRRQIFEDIKFMESESGYNINLLRHKDGRKVYYQYEDPNFTINSQPLSETEANQLKQAILTLSRFKGLPQFNWVEELSARLETSFALNNSEKEIIQFEQNEYLKGLEFISVLYNSILYKKVITIEYQGFKQKEQVKYLFHPQLLKQYNNRWFLIGMMDNNEKFTNLSLDRIISVNEEPHITYRETSSDFAELFEDAIGVSIPNDEQPKKILFQVSQSLAPYILSKPLHGSQKIIDRDKFVFELEVHINYELKSLLLSFGEGLEIIAPSELRVDFKEKYQNILKKYE